MWCIRQSDLICLHRPGEIRRAVFDSAGVAFWVVHLPSKQHQVGSIPTARSKILSAPPEKSRRGFSMGHSMIEFKQYRRKQSAELRPFIPGEKLDPRVGVSLPDLEAGSPKAGDMIARNPKSHNDQWLVAAAYFADNFEAA